MTEQDETRPIAWDDQPDQPDQTERLEHDALAAPEDDQHEPGTHPVNVAHLVMGLAFTLLVVVWALVVGDVVEGRDVRWLLPLPFLGAGAAGLVATTVRGRSRMAR